MVLAGTKSHQSTLCKSPKTSPQKALSKDLYRHTLIQEGDVEEVREGFNPDVPDVDNDVDDAHNLDYPFVVEEEENAEQKKKELKPPVSEEAAKWESRDYSDDEDRQREDRPSPSYGSFREERNVWNSSDD